jgi:tRNA-2-methylthio-N6-dimethylallyladenosine synthase
MKYHLSIFGCQYNEWDGARIKYLLDQLGFVESTAKDAEIIVMLACSVRKSATDRVFGQVENWKEKIVLIGGCLLGTDKKRFMDRGVKIFDSNDLSSLAKILPKPPRKQNDNFTAKQFNNSTNYVPIMIGCNNFCSYCAVPYTRGRELSRPFNEVMSDVNELIEKGKKEITLLGQNVNSYKFDFVKLLRNINDLPGDFMISFMSNHPKDMNDEVIKAVAELSRIKKEIHLPLQSGSDRILKAMNRPYTAKEYFKLVNKIKSKIKSVKLTTDIIVGFPGETEDDFQKTLELMKKINFAQAFVNKYSPREGTAAFSLGDPVPWPEKQRRWRILNDLANKKE